MSDANAVVRLYGVQYMSEQNCFPLVRMESHRIIYSVRVLDPHYCKSPVWKSQLADGWACEVSD